ncbi:MAG: DUF58 domain-containing protein [Candidatus Eisenbacteria bacterium]|uniref:DUF58 domain-containing protein n=1 Tax=Eiseniibacteriota bacterium TaxID=2212470 RepID=A0A538T124_UNCEI|nr:MAG: DUF58 domain-containing protein [Candidatus Eisenbacteria bacterium]
MITPELLAQVRRLTIRSRRAVEEVFAGAYRSAFRGKGLEFSEVREYVAGDDVRTIDWNVTARHGRPFVKRFDEERELTVVLALDLSGSLRFGSTARTKRNTAAEAGALLALAASRNRDRVGLLLFTDRVELYLPPSKSRARSLRIVRDLVAFEPRGTGTDLHGALAFLGRVLRRRAVLFLISDWFAESFDRPLNLLARRHEIVAVEVQDPLEEDLPARGLIQVRDLETGVTRTVNLGSAGARREWRGTRARRQRVLKEVLTRARADRIRVTCGSPVAPELVRHFEQRAFRR